VQSGIKLAPIPHLPCTASPPPHRESGGSSNKLSCKELGWSCGSSRKPLLKPQELQLIFEAKTLVDSSLLPPHIGMAYTSAVFSVHFRYLVSVSNRWYKAVFLPTVNSLSSPPPAMLSGASAVILPFTNTYIHNCN